jgi:hypothetical protein
MQRHGVASTKRRSHKRENRAGRKTYSCRCVNGQHTLRLIIRDETSLTDFVLMEELGIRLGLYRNIDTTEAIEKNHDVSLRIYEAQENPIAFEKMCVSEERS